MAHLGPARQDFEKIGLEAQGLEATAPNPVEPEREVAPFWWEVFAFFMEGFALYGAALHPTATIPVEAILAARRNWQSYADDDEPPEPAQGSARDAAGSRCNVVALGRVRPGDAYLEHRWTWLRSLGETWAETWTVLSTHLRREREIKRAVTALRDFDDRTLRDMGISGRSDIERMVRYCRDC
jgi:uncharacterized protein YjiS (DUF1127 family)